MKIDNEQYGMYTPQYESDACGTGLIVNIDNHKEHSIIDKALTMLENMEHRGACGCEINTGDGAGILTQLPDKLFRSVLKDVDLPALGNYGVGMFFFPWNLYCHNLILSEIQSVARELKYSVLDVRDVPTNNVQLGESALSSEPSIKQIFFKYYQTLSQDELERKLYYLRRRITLTLHSRYPEYSDDFYAVSLSCKTITYKGQLTSSQLRNYYLDLKDPMYESSMAMIHSRFSTNTIPKWRLAHPFRMISHNGEINTIQGNYNWWKSREKDMVSPVYNSDELNSMIPITSKGASDSAIFDNVLEFLVLNGRSIPHALMMMIPEAWQNTDALSEEKKAFYEYHESFIEPWDGPADICFTDGRYIGATLDRNGLRPARYTVTKDNILIVASETGVLPLDPNNVLKKGRLEPGKLLMVDLEEKRIVSDEELKMAICTQVPYKDWVEDARILYKNIVVKDKICEKIDDNELIISQLAQGITLEDVELILKNMAEKKDEPVGSMGADIPLAILSQNAQHLSHYFKQQFAQVTNPPIDPIREAEFMSLKSYLGGTVELLESQKNVSAYIRIDSPILDCETYEQINKIRDNRFIVGKFSATFNARYHQGDLEKVIDALCDTIEHNIAQKGINVIVLDNTVISKKLVPIPSLLITGAVHQRLIKIGKRTQTSIIIKGGDIVETHHSATLLSYGANAVYPILAYQSIVKLFNSNEINGAVSCEQCLCNYIYASEKMLLKIMSKLGISTVLSYRGAQTFEAIGIGNNVVKKCFTGTVSRIGGLDFDGIAKESLAKHSLAYSDSLNLELVDLGIYQWKRRGEFHLFNPNSIHLLQKSTVQNDYNIFKEYTRSINNQDERSCTLRSLFDFTNLKAIPLEEVEPAETIMKRFATGAMSFGSISHEAHSTLAIAMNRIGGKSNSGEGGEDENRYITKENGDSERSSIKQVASGRFGVTINYLNQATELQIKMAQGAKPGEGGQLPGHKVNEWIGRVRHSTPGVDLISPPPHHDIYSIEDLAQLIFDLKNANEKSRISVKLVSKAGVGIIAAGVAKGHSDHILISGADGGTGASPISSVRHAGVPWELGLAETHQTLLRNKLRGRVTLQTDGQIRTGKDIAIATLLGAEEWGVATAALIVEGCIMMRKCHLNTCPVGIATQDEGLRSKYTGKVDHVINFFRFLAEDMREIMAILGYRSIEEMVGQIQHLKVKEKLSHWKLETLNLSKLLYKDKTSKEIAEYKSEQQDHGIDNVLDRILVNASKDALENGNKVRVEFPIKNTDRAVGTILSGHIARKYGSVGLPEGTINFKFIGSAGQSFCAFGAKGLNFTIEGDANDFFGKGLSGAEITIYPSLNSDFVPAENSIIGNVALYGATSGKAFIYGLAGERFCVRNSGVQAVVESVGAHGCEYMTGGTVIILNSIGRNFGAGMSGGEVYLRKDYIIEEYINKSMVEIKDTTEQDILKIKSLIKEYHQNTKSETASKILENWNSQKDSFVKIISPMYERALEEMNKNKQLVEA